MARSNTASTSNWLSNATAPVTANPVSFSCWFYPNNLTADSCLVAVSDAAASSYHALLFDGANDYGAGDNKLIIDNSSAFASSSTTVASANTWNHAASVNATFSSRIAYLNGVAGTENTATVGPSGYNHTDVGAIRSTTTTFNPLDGRVAEVGIWDAALTAAEVLSLSKGVSPLFIRPNNLLRYWPIVGRGTETCLISGQTLTVNGTMAQAEHCPVFRPAPPLLSFGVFVEPEPWPPVDSPADPATIRVVQSVMSW